jgi:hypothetical protein
MDDKIEINLTLYEAKRLQVKLEKAIKDAEEIQWSTHLSTESYGKVIDIFIFPGLHKD